jgi:predicted metalloprotease
MRLDDQNESGNVEDRRGGGFGGGGGGFRLGGGRIGIGTIAIALVASYFLGVDPMTVLGALSGMDSPAPVQQGPARRPPADDAEARFVSKVLGSTEETWEQVFSQSGSHYVPPKLVLFEGATQTACGVGQTAMGPFYCPGDRKVYIDLAFYRELRERYLKERGQAPDEFAKAYVIAHEVGHHVQNLLGISSQVQQAQQRADRASANALSVRLELQADCFAGVWGKRADEAKHVIEREKGEIEVALKAAFAIGDDTLTQGRVDSRNFTHGTSEQRVRWFRRGLDSGDPNQCNTFKAASL